MKRITQLLMIILGLALSYVIALGVNGYFTFKLADFRNFTNQSSKSHLEIDNADVVDRDALIDTLLDKVDGYPIILEAGFSGDLETTFYYYGHNELISQTLIGHLTRTSDVPTVWVVRVAQSMSSSWMPYR